MGDSLLDQMRQKRRTAESVFKKFTEFNKYFKTHAFCFYEGEDGKYYDLRVKEYFGDEFITFTAGNKIEVIKVMKKIKSEKLYDNVCKMFFIDRDYDESLVDIDNDLFETPCYSIENLYVNESVFSRILKTEFGLNINDYDFSKCIYYFRQLLKDFHALIIRFNAIVKYQHLYASEIKCQFSSVKTSHLVNIDINGISKAKRHDEEIEKLIAVLGVDTDAIEKIEMDLKSADNLNQILRGKNELDFLVEIIKQLKKLNKNGKFFSCKLNSVNINLSENRLSELSQYAITPSELKVFLNEHRLMLE